VRSQRGPGRTEQCSARLRKGWGFLNSLESVPTRGVGPKHTDEGSDLWVIFDLLVDGLDILRETFEVF